MKINEFIFSLGHNPGLFSLTKQDFDLFFTPNQMPSYSFNKLSILLIMYCLLLIILKRVQKETPSLPTGLKFEQFLSFKL